jgi:predicted ABC-type transport system involved in lysophospholipase L1 biosynthesis ATPase subunit
VTTKQRLERVEHLLDLVGLSGQAAQRPGYGDALLQQVVRAEGMTAIISTHDLTLQEIADQTVRLADGVLV